MEISEKNEKIFYLINIILMGLFTVIWLIGDILMPEFETANIFQTIIMAIAAGIAGIFCIYLGIRYKLSTSTGKVWLLIGLGMFGWLIGDIIYSYYELYLDEPPFPSIADVFYLGAYLPLSLGFIIQTRVLEMELKNSEKIMIGIIYSIICILVIITVLFLPIQDWYGGEAIPSEELPSVIIGALYPIFDLFLLICVMVVLVKLRGGKINLAWILLIIGFLIMIFADILYNWKENVIGEALNWEIYDLLFLFSYMFISMGAFSVIALLTREFKET